MAGVKISSLPTVPSSKLTDLFAGVQGGVTVQETLGQVETLLGYSSGILLPVSGGTGVSNPTAFTLPVGEGAAAFTFLGPLSNGQLLIGSTGGNPVPNVLSAGPGITIANTSGNITISGSGSGMGWTEITSATFAMTADSGYIANRATLITFTLPATAALGTALSVIGKGAGGWIINQNSGQNIQIGSVSTEVGAGGSAASSNQFDSINLICTTANTTWTETGAPQGFITTV